MSSFNWHFDAAYTAVKKARLAHHIHTYIRTYSITYLYAIFDRPIIEINAGFECQLRAYAVANYDVYVAQQVLLRRRIRDLHQVREQTLNRYECIVYVLIGVS